MIDVRSPLEFWLGHLPGAVNVPVDTLRQGLDGLAGISPNSRILVYCGSGARSAAAAAILEQAGYPRVTDGGGMAEAKRDFVAA